MDYEKFEEIEDITTKTQAFLNLETQEKQKLYNQMKYSEQRSLLDQLEQTELIEFILSFEEGKRNRLYNQISDHKLKRIYKNLGEKDKQDLLKYLNDMHFNLEMEKEEKYQSINNYQKEITTNQNKIETSKNNTNHSKEEIKNNKQQLKKTKIIIKKIEKQRKQQLKKILKSSKPSVLDKIGIIKKYRTNKLIAQTERLNEIEIELNNQKTDKEKYNQNIINLRTKIAEEKENIKLSQQTITQNIERMNETTKSIGKLDVKIKKLSNSEKRILGRKLQQQQMIQREEIMTRRKTNITVSKNPEQSPPINQQTKSSNESSPLPTNINSSSNQTNQSPPKESSPNQTTVSSNQSENSTKKTIEQMQMLLENLQNLGINFLIPPQHIEENQSIQLLDNPITRMNQVQIILATQIANFYKQYAEMLQKYYQQQMNMNPEMQPNQEQGYARTRTKSNSGFVSSMLLLSFILFIFSLFLFFIK